MTDPFGRYRLANNIRRNREREAERSYYRSMYELGLQVKNAVDQAHLNGFEGIQINHPDAGNMLEQFPADHITRH